MKRTSTWRGHASESATVALFASTICFFSVSAIFVDARIALAQERSVQRGQAGDEAGRLRPPASLKCDRNRLTSYSGAVTSFRISRGRTTISLRTDWDSTETFTLRHPRRNRTPYELMLLRAEPFNQRDRAEVFTSNGRVKANMRANVWVCEDVANPVIDWQPSNGNTTSTP